MFFYKSDIKFYDSMIIKKIFLDNFIVFSAYLIFFLTQDQINSYLRPSAELYFLASLIFLPHGIRILSFLIYGYSILPGLYVAHVYTGYLVFTSTPELLDHLNILIPPLVSVFSAVIAFKLINYKIKNNFINFNINFIIKIILFTSFINSLGTNILRFFFQIGWNLRVEKEILFYFIGDVIGAAILFYFFYLIRLSLKN